MAAWSDSVGTVVSCPVGVTSFGVAWGVCVGLVTGDRGFFLALATFRHQEKWLQGFLCFFILVLE